MSYNIDPKEFGKMQADVSHIKESVDGVRQVLDQANYIRQEEADERYILRKELLGMIAIYKVATSWLGKLVVAALGILIVWAIFKTVQPSPIIKTLDNEFRTKEVRNE